MDTADYYDARDQIDGSAWHREAQGYNADATILCARCGDEAGRVCDQCGDTFCAACMVATGPLRMPIWCADCCANQRHDFETTHFPPAASITEHLHWMVAHGEVKSVECEQPYAGDSPSGTGFYSTTPEGHTMHVNGARDMPPETLAALAQLADLAFAQYAPKHDGRAAHTPRGDSV